MVTTDQPVPERPAGVAPPGVLRGRIIVSDDFDELLEEFDDYRSDPARGRGEAGRSQEYQPGSRPGWSRLIPSEAAARDWLRS